MPSNKVDLTTLIEQFSKNTPTKEKLRAATALLETLRIFSQLGNDTLYSAVQFVTDSAMNIDWSGIDFSLTKKLLAYKDPVVALDALKYFVELVAQDPTAANEKLLDSLLEELEAQKVEQQPVQPKNVEIYTERMLARVFKPAVFSSKLASILGAGLVTFRGKLASGEPGPALRGLAFDSGTNAWHTILETGEYVSIPKGDADFVLTVTENADDYAAVCPALLAYTEQIAKPLLWAGVLNPGQEHQITQDACLGTYTQTLHRLQADKENVKSLTQVLDYARENDHITPHMTGPTGASVGFNVPGTDMSVVLDALPSQTGPYIVARLMRGSTVLMRLEHPRYFSARGVYLFPLQTCAVSLTVMY